MSAVRRKASRRRAPSDGGGFALKFSQVPGGGKHGFLLRMIAMMAIDEVLATLQLSLRRAGDGALAREFAPIGRELHAMIREMKSGK